MAKVRVIKVGFKVGDAVYLKAGGSPKMVVDDVDLDYRGTQPYVGCTWYSNASADFQHRSFRPEMLVKCRPDPKRPEVKFV